MMRRYVLSLLLALAAVFPAGAADSALSLPGVEQETITLRTNDGEILVESITRGEKAGRIFYAIESQGTSGRKLSMELNDDLTPVLVRQLDPNGRIIRLAEYKKGQVHLVFAEKGIDRLIAAPTPIYDQQTLFYVLRGFPFENKARLAMNLLVQDGIKARVEIKNLGRVEAVLGGERRQAYKLQMRPVGLLSILYTGRFYFAAGEPHGFLRFEDDGGRFAEVTGIPAGVTGASGGS